MAEASEGATVAAGETAMGSQEAGSAVAELRAAAGKAARAARVAGPGGKRVREAVAEEPVVVAASRAMAATMAEGWVMAAAASVG